MYVYMYVAIRRPHAHHTRAYCACMQIDTTKIVTIDRVLARNVVHQTTEERLLEAQADLD